MDIRKHSGFSLLQLVVTLAVVAILASITVPAFDSLLARTRLAAATNLFVTTLHYARSEAVRSGLYVTICPGDAQGCRARDYEDGWIVFQDLNHDGARQPEEALVQVFEALARGMSMRGNSTVRSYITYTPLGYTERSSGAFQAGSLTVCASTSGRRIVISRTGRPRTEEITC